MHELSLFTQIPSPRRHQILQILAGVAGMQPTPILERHLVFKPVEKAAPKAAAVGGSQGVRDQQRAARRAAPQAAVKELFYLRLVEDLEGESGEGVGAEEEDGAGEEEDGMAKVEAEAEEAGGKQARWTMRFEDVPEAGKRAVTARAVTVTDIVDGDPVGLMDGLGYQFVDQYVLRGQQLVYGNVVLSFHQILRFPETLSEARYRPRTPCPPVSALELLDASGAWALKASIRVLDGSKPELMTRGTNELLEFKELMKGCLDLRVGDRLALDTRVK